MSLLDYFKVVRDVPQEELEIPLFPLKSVLFPGGNLALKVFEKRYLDMCADCLKNEKPFGICLILKGEETGVPATPYSVGTLAHVSSWDMEQLGILQLGVRGGRRFRILETRTEADGLQRARVLLLGEPAAVPVPVAQEGLLPILQKVAADLGPEKMPLPHPWDDAAWVGYRLTEVMPVQLLAKQKLLELDDAVSRLEILFKYLAQRGLVK
ncbi:MAG: LON peptidase substrate-binding domain-containing protein [Betaproteobacteria bacterium]|uniref:LON peptidase substrate-binding domain-containing protein n=1 Tax=Candidatus Proximibacter danicus TaxID=2954365 RepID=A0A9D7K3I5_9PROT|nr:LON peptidase substrate-binding domain-containing protein [Candidatus Proximibacter danicus]